MKTVEQLLEYKNDGCIDGRDIFRLADFIPVEHWEKLGLAPADGVDPATIKILPLTREAVLERLKEDLEFAFEKATGKRGISASLMCDVVKMWMWVLDDPLADAENYAQYGLPILKAVALKYGLPNPIGEDRGDESKYAID